MRNRISDTALVISLCLGMPLVASAATGDTAKAPSGNFEGNVTMQISTDRTSGPQTVTVHVKGERTRYDLPPSSNEQHEPLTAIVDMAKKQVMLVMPAQKSYAVLDMNKIPPQSRQATAQRLEGTAADWTASPTGATKNVAGHDCNQWQAADKKTNVKIDACLAPGVRVDFDRMLPASLLPPSWADKLRNGELPLAATVYSADGKQTFNAQVTSVTPKPVPQSEFTPPAGYKRVTLPLTAFGDLLPATR